MQNISYWLSESWYLDYELFYLECTCYWCWKSDWNRLVLSAPGICVGKTIDRNPISSGVDLECTRSLRGYYWGTVFLWRESPPDSGVGKWDRVVPVQSVTLLFMCPYCYLLLPLKIGPTICIQSPTVFELTPWCIYRFEEGGKPIKSLSEEFLAL